jgi:hypothetical protein
MQIKGNSDLWRRVRLYGFGFIIGLIGVYFFFGNRNYKILTPGMLKLDQLAGQTIHYSDTVRCQMKCEGIDTAEVREAMLVGKVDSKKSQDFNQHHPLFNFNGKTLKGDTLNIICMQFDSITRIIYVHDVAKKDTCRCP